MNWRHSRVRKIGGKILLILSFFDHLISTRKSKVVNSPANVHLDGQKIAIYVTYPSLLQDNCENRLLKSLENLGYKTLVVANIESSTLLEVEGIVSEGVWLVRRNYGYDLAAVRDALTFTSGVPTHFLVVNSSIAWGPGTQEFLMELERNLEQYPDKIIALTQSMQRKEHAQSFFFLSGTKTFQLLADSYSQMRNWHFKRSAVNFGEISMSQRLLRETPNSIFYKFSYNGLVHSLVSTDNNYHDGKHGYVNPSHDLWAVILRLGGPFVKRNLKLPISCNNFWSKRECMTISHKCHI